ncbi:UNVERIFIED_CONTAM: hypothetical protein Scaly_2335600 [Sesamum calycinum]|uniref:Uncharacterized protein n=1 Tax=Sesamum calycinum TaxID=2727403 RepID=A0AAW2LWW4_9LAMI
MCTTPIQVTSSQLISSDVFPLPVVKALLYPGAVVNGLISNMTVPSWDNLLSVYNLTSIKEASAVTDLQRLEVLAGSYFCVAGSLIGLVKPGRMIKYDIKKVVRSTPAQPVAKPLKSSSKSKLK